MKKEKIIVCILTMTIACSFGTPVHAYDFSNEDEWYGYCSEPQDDEEGVNACRAFQKHQAEKEKKLSEDIKKYNASINTLEENAEKMEALAKEQKELADNLSKQIKNKEEHIKKIGTNIQKYQVKIDKKQAEIDVWDEQIKTRMRSEQAGTGTNMVLELIMGSQDLNDMLRRVRGIERITEDDQDQIKRLNKLKEELEFKKQELVRLQDEAKKEKETLQEKKDEVKELEESYRTLVKEYKKQVADLQAAKRAAQADMDAIRSFTISTNYSGSIVSVSGFSNPIKRGSLSAGTWAYPGGGLHLGLDWAAPIGTDVSAPASGLIIYANNPVATNSGHLGNWSGHPSGGGNTIQMLCKVNGILYAVSFFHLAQEGFRVHAGQSVSTGQSIAKVGNSGNTSGPHCHIEVIKLGSMSLDKAVKKFSGNADFSRGTGWTTTSTSCDATGGKSPCRERPEKFFHGR